MYTHDTRIHLHCTIQYSELYTHVPAEVVAVRGCEEGGCEEGGCEEGGCEEGGCEEGGCEEGGCEEGGCEEGGCEEGGCEEGAILFLPLSRAKKLSLLLFGTAME